MSAIFANWKTTLTAFLIIALSVLGLFGIHVPGFNLDIGAAISMALGLFVAGDASASVTKK